MIDFLIIGGGIAGISAAARLAPLGSVTVLEAEDGLGYHASGRSAAMFEENYGSPSTIALNRASRDFLTTAHGGVLSPRGFMMVAAPHEAHAFAATFAELGMETISVAEAARKIPIINTDKMDRAGFHEDAQDIDTDLLLQNYARMARAKGAKIETRSRVIAIRKTATGWTVQTDTSDHTARILINAAGAWVDKVAQLAGIAPIGFTPNRRSMARIPAPGGHDVTNWPMLFGPGESWYAKPDAGKFLVSPAEEDPTTPHDAWADDMVLAEGIARYEAAVTESVTRVEHTWAGLRTFSPDRSLVIGFEPSDATFFWLAGQGGYGMQSSPAASQLTADLIAGCPPELDETALRQLGPGRFG